MLWGLLSFTQRFICSSYWNVGCWRLQYLLAYCLYVMPLKRLGVWLTDVKGKQKPVLQSPGCPAVEHPPLDFSIPCCRWHLLCWCLSRVFSPRVSPAREVEEKELTVQPLQEAIATTALTTTSSDHSSVTLESRGRPPHAIKKDILNWGLSAVGVSKLSKSSSH